MSISVHIFIILLIIVITNIFMLYLKEKMIVALESINDSNEKSIKALESINESKEKSIQALESINKSNENSIEALKSTIKALKADTSKQHKMYTFTHYIKVC
jgi:hypothetical protein